MRCVLEPGRSTLHYAGRPLHPPSPPVNPTLSQSEHQDQTFTTVQLDVLALKSLVKEMFVDTGVFWGSRGSPGLCCRDVLLMGLHITGPGLMGKQVA